MLRNLALSITLVCTFLASIAAMAAGLKPPVNSAPVAATKTVYPNGATIMNYETKGNLQSNYDIGCIALKNARNVYTPADLFRAVPVCINQKKYDKAFGIYALGGAYGAFDSARVADQTAHQAVQALLDKYMTTIKDEHDKENWKAEAETLKDPNSPEMKKICSEIIKIGPPAYHPAYMIQHGIAAFFPQKRGPDLVEHFDADDTWDKVIHNYLKCKN